MSLVTDENGKVKGTFKVPANIPVGTKLVQFTGDKGSYGEASYTSRGIIQQSNADVLLLLLIV